MKTWTGVCRDNGNDKAKGSRRAPGKLSTKCFLGSHRFSIYTTVGPSCSQMCSYFYGLLLDEGHSPDPWCQVGVWLILVKGMLGNLMPTEAGSGLHSKTHPPAHLTPSQELIPESRSPSSLGFDMRNSYPRQLHTCEREINASACLRFWGCVLCSKSCLIQCLTIPAKNAYFHFSVGAVTCQSQLPVKQRQSPFSLFPLC